MSPLERWSLHLAALATAGTGLLDGLLRWFGPRAGEFGPEPHPWLGMAQHLHVLLAPLLLFVLGMTVRGHLRARLRKGPEGRRTGLGAAFLITPMVMTGYGVQVVTSPAWRGGLSWAHGISAGLFLLAYLGHLAIRAPRRRCLRRRVRRADSREPIADSFLPMSRIRILPDQVANQIAAGEVVERPASVLKELVENALDAGARHVEVAWEEGGKRLLEVADDGSGLARDDLYLALERHATSKVRTADDLGHLATFGFRGEALPSIAAVSRFDLASAETEGAGHRLRCEFGIIKEVVPASRSRGTTVTVRDLFAQLPARRRFLKSTDTEHAQLWGAVARLALSSPGVHWTIRPDRGAPLALPPVESAGQRLAPLLGEKLARLVPFVNGELPWRLRGFVSPPDLSFRDRNHLYLFVNGRAVRDRLLLAALSEAWSGTFAKGSYPAAVLFLELPPEAVDVNVHPTKAEVRFREPQRIFAWVRGGAEEAWAKLRGGLASVLELPPKPQEAEFELDPSRRTAPAHPRLWSDHSGGALGGYQALADTFATRPLETVYAYEPAPSGVAEGLGTGAGIRYLGTFERTYLLAEIVGVAGPELWIVDQHVAHERVLFERLFLRRHAPAIQPLMPPQVVRLGPEALARLTPFLSEMEAAGVEAEPFGGDALVVRGLPDFLVERDPQALLEDLLARLEREGRVDLDAFRRDLNAELACRAAIKKHHALPSDLALGLIQDLLACEVPNTCPHGRPIIKKLSLADLERSFGRRM